MYPQNWNSFLHGNKQCVALSKYTVLEFRKFFRCFNNSSLYSKQSCWFKNSPKTVFTAVPISNCNVCKGSNLKKEYASLETKHSTLFAFSRMHSELEALMTQNAPVFYPLFLSYTLLYLFDGLQRYYHWISCTILFFSEYHFTNRVSSFILTNVPRDTRNLI